MSMRPGCSGDVLHIVAHTWHCSLPQVYHSHLVSTPDLLCVIYIHTFVCGWNISSPEKRLCIHFSAPSMQFLPSPPHMVRQMDILWNAIYGRVPELSTRQSACNVGYNNS